MIWINILIGLILLFAGRRLFRLFVAGVGFASGYHYAMQKRQILVQPTGGKCYVKKTLVLISVFYRRYLFFVLLLFYVVCCAEVPITHRKSLHLVPQSELLTMSLQQYDEVLKNSKLSTDQQKVQMVRNVGFKIAKAAEAFLAEAGQSVDIKNYKWDFNLIEDDKTVNAWVMPGGKTAVYTGILPYTQDETGLAVVLGHEVGHELADHGNEQMSDELVAQMGGMALSVALSS